MASVFAVDDTIVAIATPPGRGGIGVVRLSGPEAARVALAIVTRRTSLAPRIATAATDPGVQQSIAGVDGDQGVDHVIAIYFPGPQSYTGDDVVEISAHGSPGVLHRIAAGAVAAGARPARAGEFTLRAFLNGRIDLTQAEAVADLIEAATPLQAETAFDQLQGTLTQALAGIDATLLDLTARLEASVDFPEEGYHFIDATELAAEIDGVRAQVRALLRDARRGRVIREGLQAAIIGPPNAGKSSLFNALVGGSRAIVTDVPGTTRDMVTEVVDVGGLRVTLADTAGLREATDAVEAEGVRRTEGAAAVADVVLIVGDRSRSEDEATVRALAVRFGARAVVVANKADVLGAWSGGAAVEVSALTGAGIDDLRRRVGSALDVEWPAERPAMTNVRHIALAERTLAALTDGTSLPEEFVLADLREARQALEEVTGRRTPEDILAHIFVRFCIGK